MENIQKPLPLFLVGRILLGLYFLVPGLLKVMSFDGTAEYMAAHGMIFIPFYLVLTIIVQLSGGRESNSRLSRTGGVVCIGGPGISH